MDKKTINKLTGKFDEKQLRELIVYIAGTSEAAGELLLNYCREKDEEVKTDNHALIIESKIKLHWKKAGEIIEEFDMYGGGPESEEDIAYYELGEMEKLIEESEVSWVVRKEILDQLLELVASDNSGFTDYLMDIAFVMCKTKGENLYLANFLDKNAGSYYKDVAARIYLKNGEDEKFIESKKANLQYESDYLELAAYYKKHKDEKKALEIVLEGLHKTNGRLDGIYEYLFRYYKKKKDETALEKLYAGAEKRRWNQDTITELMHGYYQEKGDYKKQKDALIKLISCCDERWLYKLYQQCGQELAEEDFQKEEQEILKVIRKRKISVYFDILMDKDETAEVIEYLMEHQHYGGWGGLDEGHYFSKRLAGSYPREIVEMYRKEVSYYVSLGKEKNYSHAVGVLKEIKGIMKRNKWTDEWDVEYRAFLEEHKRKKLLLGALERAKL